MDMATLARRDASHWLHFNTWWGCCKVSQECKHCYAEGIAARYGHRCASMADVFEDHPDVGPAREQLWSLIEQTPWLNWLLLTKRPELIGRCSPWSANQWPDNVWLGTSIGLQQHVAPRLEALLSHPAVVRFVSCEPLLGSLDLTPWLSALQWVILRRRERRGCPAHVACLGAFLTGAVSGRKRALSSSSSGVDAPMPQVGGCWTGAPGTRCHWRDQCQPYTGNRRWCRHARRQGNEAAQAPPHKSLRTADDHQSRDPHPAGSGQCGQTCCSG